MKESKCKSTRKVASINKKNKKEKKRKRSYAWFQVDTIKRKKKEKIHSK